MFGDPAAERAAIEATYEDIATVKDMRPQTGPDKVTHMVEIEVYTDVACALSAKTDRSDQTDAQHTIEYDMVLFAAPYLAIKAGQTVMVRRFGRDDPGSLLVHAFEVVGRPIVYATHQEVALKARDLA